MSGLDLGLLECFADVAELGSFTAAAKRRGVSQPAISMKLRQLERQLGIRLVERVGRSVSPTHAGQDLLAHVAALRAEVAKALASIVPHQAGELGQVRIGTGATACIYLLPPVLRRLRGRMPALSIIVETGNTPELLSQIEDNALDIGFVTLPARGRALSVEPVRREELLAVFPDDAPTFAAANPATMAAQGLILYEPGGGTRGLVDSWFAGEGLSPRPIMQLGSVEAIKELVGAGLGAAILPAAAVHGAGARPGLRTMSLVPRLHRTLGLVMRRDKVLDRGLREVVGALRSLA